MAYSATPPAPQQRTPADGITMGNTLLLNSTGNKKPLAIAKEIKGGLHFVEYLEYLGENEFRGITIGRREEGMLAYVKFRRENGVDVPLKKYYSLVELAGDGSATWEEMSFGNGGTITTNDTYPVATIAERNALQDLVPGDIVIVADASGDTTVVPTLTGGATYIYTDDPSTPWLRFLYPNDPRLADSHKQNTDTALRVIIEGNPDVFLTARAIYDHITDSSVHFKINDLNEQGSVEEVYSSRKVKEEFLQKNPEGDADKFFNERGELVKVTAIVNIIRINGGTPSTKFPA